MMKSGHDSGWDSLEIKRYECECILGEVKIDLREILSELEIDRDGLFW